jgi:hypothetical protein
MIRNHGSVALSQNLFAVLIAIIAIKTANDVLIHF